MMSNGLLRSRPFGVLGGYLVLCALLGHCAMAAPGEQDAAPERGHYYQKWIEELKWTWNERDVGPLNCVAMCKRSVNNEKFTFRITTLPRKCNHHHLEIAVLKNDKVIVAWKGYYDTVFTVDNETLCYMDWAPGGSGGDAVAVDLENGKELWRKPVTGLGDVQHSQYLTRFIIKPVGEGVVEIWGDESQGRYVELKDVRTGETVAHKVFPDDSEPAQDRAPSESK